MSKCVQGADVQRVHEVSLGGFVLEGLLCGIGIERRSGTKNRKFLNANPSGCEVMASLCNPTPLLRLQELGNPNRKKQQDDDSNSEA